MDSSVYNNYYTTTGTADSCNISCITTNTIEEKSKYLEDILKLVDKYGKDEVIEWCKNMDKKKKEEAEEAKRKLEESRISPRKLMPALVNVTFQEEKGLICAIWEDGSKTFVKANKEEWDPVKGMAMAICKKYMGDNYDYIEKFKKLKTIKDFYKKGSNK